MSLEIVTAIGREVLLLTLILVGPVVVVSLLLGLLVSIGQTVTGIQEQTLSFAPRIVAATATMIAMLPWYLNHLTDFTERMFQMITRISQ